ncbi:MAG: hypothetical protein SOV20_08840 [Coriobacteriales bacterium]|nr:hypothetical protein [Coriobacteriaceae bacterium]MDY2723904.1 hypothetical protein [Coriobacteriales bacterium]
MGHTITYTAYDGTEYALSSLRSDDGALWGNSLMGYDFDADDTTGLMTRGAESFDVTAEFASVGKANAFVSQVYADAQDGHDGTLEVDGWQLTCKVKTAAPETVMGGHARCSMTIYAKTPLWRRIRSHVLVPSSGTQTDETGLDYPTDYEFDYSGVMASSATNIMSVGTASLLRITFFGPCSSPYARVSVSSGGTTTTNVYGVDAEATSGERIVIDPLGIYTIGGSVYKVGQYGERTNLFDKRRRGVEGSGSYIFQRMPAGEMRVSWPQSFGVTVETIEERGSLPWT